jgi:hypothetical protein
VPVLDQFQSQHEPPAPHITNQVVLLLQTPQTLKQVLTNLQPHRDTWIDWGQKCAVRHARIQSATPPGGALLLQLLKQVLTNLRPQRDTWIDWGYQRAVKHNVTVSGVD